MHSRLLNFFLVARQRGFIAHYTSAVSFFKKPEPSNFCLSLVSLLLQQKVVRVNLRSTKHSQRWRKETGLGDACTTPALSFFFNALGSNEAFSHNKNESQDLFQLLLR